jgi:hypothetical protein
VDGHIRPNINIGICVQTGRGSNNMELNEAKCSGPIIDLEAEYTAMVHATPNSPLSWACLQLEGVLWNKPKIRDIPRLTEEGTLPIDQIRDDNMYNFDDDPIYYDLENTDEDQRLSY